MKPFLLILCCSLIAVQSWGQSGCSARGQTPASAFPVCGTAVFIQQEVPSCTNSPIPVSGCSFDQILYEDQSPFWYKFTCFKSGTLGFLIDPVSDTDDYDWQLFDVTGQDPGAVYTDPSLFVAGNWSGEDGNTGTARNAKSILVCASLGEGSPYRPLFSQMPQIRKGHHYLLLVSHFSGSSQSGYKLSFGGGSAVITDTTAPRLKRAIGVCDGRSATIYLNKGMKCASLASDGSDFKLLHTAVSIDSAYSRACTTGFDMDELTLTFNGKLSPGIYTVVIQKGSDQNTLLDNCGNAIPDGDTLQFVLQEIHPTPMDSIKDIGCAPKKIRVVFAGPMRCNSIAKDGSDFSIKNSHTNEPLKITGAKAIDCQNNLSKTIEIDLAKPIYQKGMYELTLHRGKDGNSVISECDVASVIQTLTFKSYDTVSAGIDRRLSYSCNKVKIRLSNPGGNEIDEWRWLLPSGRSGNEPQITYTDTTFDDQRIRLTVSNGVCSDEKQLKLSLNQDYYLHAAFEEPEFVCPQDPVLFRDKSVGGNIRKWNWSFGNGTRFFGPDPDVQHYPGVVRTKDFPVQLVVSNSKGCIDTAFKNIKVINTCIVHVPTAFTPNHDGQNDYLYPLNAYLAKDLIFRIYNRYGQMVFQTKDWTKKWDGTFNGEKQPPGSYVWMLKFTNSKTGRKVFRKGATLLIR